MFNVNHLQKVFSNVRQNLSRLGRGRNAGRRSQWDDLGNLHVSNNEGSKITTRPVVSG